MKTITVTIEGVASLLQHRFGEQAEADVQASTRLVGPRRGTPREEAEKVAYRFPDGSHYHPGASIARLLREAGSNHKMTGTRKSAKFAVPSAVIVTEDAIPLVDPDTKTPIVEFEVDSRPVVIPATKGRVMRHRPRHDRWQMTFHLQIDDNMLPVTFVQELLEEGGRKLGIGDFRPEKGGPFGRFAITSWQNGA